jgi:hypothetical protein
MQNLHQIIEVQAAADHLSSVANAGVRTALAELIWNSVDADATEVDVNFIRNELDTVEKIEVRDNGTGMPRERAEQSFGAIGGSWKKHAVYSTKERRQLHGRNGKGRLTAFSIGQKVTWLSRFFTAEGMHSFETFGVYDNLRSINISAVTKVLAASTGTIVKITALSDKATQNLGSTEKLVEWVATEFSSYLRSYPHIVITIDGMRVDPSIVEDHVYETELPPVELNDGKVYPAKLRIVEWLSKGERKLCLCDAGGFTVGSIDTGIRPGAEFSYTAYLCSDYFRELEAENAID